MTINTVVARKQRKAASQKSRRELRIDLINEFITFIEESQLEELHNLFPSVVIGDRSSTALAVTYSPSRIAGFKRHTSGNDTYNVVMDSIKDQFNIGYSANSAGGSKSIPFDLSTLNKTKKKKLFKDIVKCLVSEAYWTGYKNDKEHQVWKGYDRIK